MLRTRVLQSFIKPCFLFFLVAGSAFIFVHPTPAPSKDNRAPDLIRAIRDGQTKKANKLINQNKDINVKGDHGWTPLMYAIFRGDSGLVENLISHGADVNVPDEDGITPLIASIIFAPQPFIIQYLPPGDRLGQDIPIILVEKGADPNRADNDGNTPLIYAVIGYRASIVEALLKKGADPNRPDGHGRTPLYFIDNPDKAAEWAPAEGALNYNYRMRLLPSDESGFSPEFAAKVKEVRAQASLMIERLKKGITDLLKSAGAAVPDPAKIQAATNHQLNSRPQNMGSPVNLFTEVIMHEGVTPRREGGRFSMLVRITADGTVKKTLVLYGMPDGITEKLEQAAMKLRFHPAMKGGQLVETWDKIFGTMPAPKAILR
jgi:hypothetical protein